MKRGVHKKNAVAGTWSQSRLKTYKLLRFG
jgi:hypothetical protein